MADDDLREQIARALADASNVPFVGPRQRRQADAVLAVIGPRCSCGMPYPEDGGKEGVCECCSGCAVDYARARAAGREDGLREAEQAVRAQRDMYRVVLARAVVGEAADALARLRAEGAT